MKTLLTCNLTTGAVNDGSAAWSPRAYTFGETLTLALAFQQNVDGNAVDISPTITALQAVFTAIDQRPLGGGFCLQIGPGSSTGANTTAALLFDSRASELAAAINALSAVVASYGTCTVIEVPGSWLLGFGTGAASVPLQLRNNRLWPETVGRVMSYQLNGTWMQELRLTQSPVAFTDASELVLPPAPTITEVTAGGTSGGFTWNEVQSLYVPPDFTGTYRLKWNGVKSALLSQADTAATIQAALNAIVATGYSFNVTNPASFTANIEFTGTFAGVPQALLQLDAFPAAPGNLTFTLSFDQEPLAKLLRAQSSVTLMLEVWVTVTDSAEDAEAQQIVAIRQQITINAPGAFPELATIPAVDWLRPLSPKDYVPFSTSAVITGQQYFPAVVGDGTATIFPINHGLATEAVFVFARINASGGRQLVDGVDFSVVINSANEVTVTALAGAPALNNWAVIVMSAQTVGAFANGLTVTIGQVTGLEAVIDSLTASLATITALLPTAPPTIASGSTTLLTLPIGSRSEVWPGRFKLGFDPLAAAASGAALPQASALLPALHVSSTVNAVLPLVDPTTVGGIVYLNNTGSPIALPGGSFGHKGESVPVGGFYGSDGRLWYALNNVTGTKSYFPASLEREIFILSINDSQLRAGRLLTVQFDLALGLLANNSRAQVLLVLEAGTVPTQTTPATTAENLLNVTWGATPLLTQRLILSRTQETHHFGVSVSRSAVGTLSANKLLYLDWLAADAIPADPNFALRARLVQFDTENAITNPSGFVFYSMLNAAATIASA
jgi:hypothetical protein